MLSLSSLQSQKPTRYLPVQDLDAALTRALNTDDIERAQDLRERLQKVDEAVQEIQASCQHNCMAL